MISPIDPLTAATIGLGLALGLTGWAVILAVRWAAGSAAGG